MSKVTTLLEQEWGGTHLNETVKCGEKRFKIVTGLANGGGENRVYILGDNGWNYFLSRSDVPYFNNNTTYVSNEGERREYAEKLNGLFKIAIAKIF